MEGGVDEGTVLPEARLGVKLYNIVSTVAWAVMVPIAYLLGWFESITFIAAASIYANFASHLAAWRADVPIPGGE